MNYIVFLEGHQICRVSDVCRIVCEEGFFRFMRSTVEGDELYPVGFPSDKVEVVQAEFNIDKICGYAWEAKNPTGDPGLEERVTRVENYLRAASSDAAASVNRTGDMN